MNVSYVTSWVKPLSEVIMVVVVRLRWLHRSRHRDRWLNRKSTTFCESKFRRFRSNYPSVYCFYPTLDASNFWQWGVLWRWDASNLLSTPSRGNKFPWSSHLPITPMRRWDASNFSSLPRQFFARTLERRVPSWSLLPFLIWIDSPSRSLSFPFSFFPPTHEDSLGVSSLPPRKRNHFSDLTAWPTFPALSEAKIIRVSQGTPSYISSVINSAPTFSVLHCLAGTKLASQQPIFEPSKDWRGLLNLNFWTEVGDFRDFLAGLPRQTASTA